MRLHVVEMVMQLTPLRYVTVAAVAVLGAGLIAVTPVVAPNVEQRAVELVAAGDIIDLGSPLTALVSSLGGVDASPLASVTEALASGGGALSGALAGELPSFGDISGTFEDYIQAFLLVASILLGFWVVIPVDWFFTTAYEWIAGVFGFDPYPAAMAGLGTGLLDIHDAGVVDPALPAGASTFLGDITSLFSGTTGVLDSTTLAQDLGTALDPSAVTSDLGTALDPSALASILDPSAIADPGTVFDPAGIADIGTLLSTGLIPDIGM